MNQINQMFQFLGGLFRKKSNPNLTKIELEEAKNKGFITEEEFLLLKSRRADKEFKDFVKAMNKK